MESTRTQWTRFLCIFSHGHSMFSTGQGIARGIPIEDCLWHLVHLMIIWLVVEPTPLKNMKVSWDDEIPKIWENKKCSKPPTRYIYTYIYIHIYIHIYTYIYIHTYIYTYIYIYTYMYCCWDVCCLPYIYIHMYDLLFIRVGKLTLKH